MTRVLIVIAAAMGAAGVVLAALGSHAAADSRLATIASSMLLFHAPVILAAVGLAARQLVHEGIARGAAIGFVAGAALFAGDLMAREFAGRALFPMATPSGGTILILSWLALALAGLTKPSS